MEVELHEFEVRLSEFVGRAAAGEAVVVTEGGAPVVQLVPFAGGSSVGRGIEEGWIDAPRRTTLGAAQPRGSARSIGEVLAEDRG